MRIHSCYRSCYRCAILFQLLAVTLFVGPAFGELLFPTAVHLGSPVYFQQPDGHPIQLQAGVYEVERGEDAVLNVYAVGAKEDDSVTIQAISAEHDLELTEATAELIPSPDQDADTQHLLLWMPDGEALEAVGSFSGVFSRSVLTWAIATSGGADGLPEETLTVDFEESISFKTVGGDPTAIQAGQYEVSIDEHGLVLSSTTSAQGDSITVETESLGTSLAVLLPGLSGNSDLELLMIGTANGQSLMAMGSHSGTFPRGVFGEIGKGLKKAGGKIKSGAGKIGGGVKKGMTRVGSGIKTGAKFAHGKVGRHVVKHARKGIQAGVKYGDKYGKKIAVGAYRVGEKAGKEVVKFCTGSIQQAHTCYKVGKMAAMVAAS
ncbi:MAG: hypothetical protein MRJ96_08800 [Nitrospirales bacterium]|nr:hypothetical protein [Nitrospira sp.]MDR4501532.1 hypothetical protein [Nitrospirales bacterium]